MSDKTALEIVFIYHPQFIVGEDGTCGLVYEHAPAEGPPIVFLIDYVVRYMYVRHIHALLDKNI